jgi:hypothetical protein
VQRKRIDTSYYASLNDNLFDIEDDDERELRKMKIQSVSILKIRKKKVNIC